MLLALVLAAAASPVREVRLSCPAPDRPLGASLWLPAVATGPLPTAVVLVGAQPWDRNGDLPGTPWGHYRDVARAVAEAGGAALLFDKGGTGETGGDPADLDQRVREAVAAVACVRARPEVDDARVVFVGHSQGSVVAARAARAAGVAGLVLLSPVVGAAEVPALPLVIVRGEADGGRAADEALLKARPDATHVLVPNGGHLLFEGDTSPGVSHVSVVATGAVARAVVR